MGFIQKITAWFASSSRLDESAYWIKVSCTRCGELIQTRVDLRNDLSPEFDPGSGEPTYFCRKVLMGESGRCFQRVEVGLTFDASRRLVNRDIRGGIFVNEQPA